MKIENIANATSEGQKHWLCAAIVTPLYGTTSSRWLRSCLRRLALRLEGGAMYSLTVREIYRKYHDLEVGLYTIGPCESGPENFAPGTTIGRYCSIYYTVRTIGPDQDGLVASRPCDRVADASSESSTRRRLVIGNDVFIGHNAIILPSVTHIGDGAFIGAGAVVQNPVPPYAVVMGNPARVVKYRFSETLIEELLESRWWEKPLRDLADDRQSFEVALEGRPCQR